MIHCTKIFIIQNIFKFMWNSRTKVFLLTKYWSGVIIMDWVSNVTLVTLVNWTLHQSSKKQFEINVKVSSGGVLNSTLPVICKLFEINKLYIIQYYTIDCIEFQYIFFLDLRHVLEGYKISESIYFWMDFLEESRIFISVNFFWRYFGGIVDLWSMDF